MFIARISCVAAASLLSATAHADTASDNLETIFVTASPVSTDANQSAVIVDSVDRHQILQQGGANLADALANAPGITGTSFAGGASRPVIRGFDANRVRVLEDGISSFDVSDVGPDHGVPIDPLSAERIEVVRGPATLRYGSQAIGGVVNAINNRVPLQLPDQPVSATFSGAFGGAATTRQLAGGLDAGAGQFAVHADGFRRHTDDYDIPDGTQPNSWFKGDGYSLGSSYFFGADNDSRVGIGGVHYDSQYGIPSDTTYIDMKQTKGMLRSSFALKAGALQKLDVEGGYADYEHDERDPLTGEALSTFKDNEWEARAEGVFGTIGPFSGSALGVQAQKRNFSALGEGANYLLPTTTQSSAAFVFTEASFTKTLRLQAGARLERVSAQGTPASGEQTSRHFTPISASAGLVFDPSDVLRLGLTLSSAARAPAQTELFARGPHEGPATFETGDSTLSVERANSLEGSLRWRLSKVTLDASLWGTQFNHYIYGRLTGRSCDEDGVCVDDNSLALRELNYTQVDAKFWGSEVKSTISLYANAKGALNAEILADYVRAKTADGENLPRITPYHVGAGLSWEGKAIDGGVFWKYTGRRGENEIAPAETPTAGFVSVDAHLGWRPVPSNQDMEIALVGHNLTDTVQRNAIALNKDTVILPGRDVRLVATVKF